MESPTPALFEILKFGGLMLLFAVFCVYPFWRICSKTGYSGALGLLVFVPVANIFLLFFLAFSKWPIEKQIEQLQPEAQARQQDNHAE
jgi:hypothetical protein